MIAAALVLILAQDADLERRIDRLVERLREDDIEARDAAGRELEALGPPAVAGLLRRAEKAEPEIKARLAGAAREIGRKERIAAYLGRPARITLKAEGRPFKEVLAELARRSPYALRGEGADLERPVTVDLRDASWFEAVERICRAHGAAVPQLENHYYFQEDDPPQVHLVKGDPAALRRRVEGAFLVELRGVSHTTEGPVDGARTEESSLALDVAWEAGAQPLRSRLELTSVLDDEGRPLETGAADEAEDGLFAQAQMQFYVPFKQPLPAKLRSFRRIAGKATLEFPGDLWVSTVERPAGRRDVAATGDAEAGFTLRSCVRKKGAFTVVYEMPAAPEDLEIDSRRQIRLSLVDAAGRTYRVGGEEGRVEDQKVTWTGQAEVPEGVEPVELRALKLEIDKLRRLERRIEFAFEDVRFR